MGGELGDGAAIPAAEQDSDKKKKKLVAKVIEITFDSGLDLLEKKKKITGPHWKYRRKKIKPACYTRKSGGGKKKLHVKIDITKLENISGNAVLVGEGGDMKIKSSSFPLSKGKSGSIDCEFNEFPETLRYYNKSPIAWTIEQGADKYPLANMTPVVLFVIFNTPAKPWTATGVKAGWVEALTFLFSKVGIDFYKSKKSAMGKIGRHLHAGHKLRYDTKHGSPSYGVVRDWPGVFQLKDYLKRKYKKVNCYDQAAALTALSAALGIGADYLFLEPFGKIKTTNLIGIGPCNNPFFENYSPSVPEGRPIVNPGHPNRTGFGNHAFVGYTPKAYDACAGPALGTRSRKGYLEHAIDVIHSYPGVPDAIDQLVALIKSGVNFSVD